MGRWQFWIDVGGTFTDCIGLAPDGTERQHKTLSSGVVKGVVGPSSSVGQIVDPRRSHDPNGVWTGYDVRIDQEEGVCRVGAFHQGVLRIETDKTPESPLSPSKDRRLADRGSGGFREVSGMTTPVRGTPYELFSNEPAPLVAIRYLLGCSRFDSLPAIDVRLGTTRGTNALLTRTGGQTALVVTKGFRDVLRIGYQTRPDLFALDIQQPDEIYDVVIEIDERLSASGNVLQPAKSDEIRSVLEEIRHQGYSALAVVLMHSCVNPSHELIVGQIARELGFAHISLSHEVSSLRKLVPRGDTAVIDAYLNPVLHDYVDNIKGALHPDSELQLMNSAGALVEAERFRGKDSILSGPAGGVVGMARAAHQAGFVQAIGFDMGGTSTDVSRWGGDFELQFENEKAGVRIASPMISIETVAAGGGSLCRFDGVKLTVGPASAGADPGPACYGAGGPLAITDINFFLGKIMPAAFPFELDREAVTRALTEQAEAIREATGELPSLADLAEGYVRVANSNMADAIRTVSVERGADPRDHVLVAFGGAAAQHACGVAEALAITEVLLHPEAGILSAFGLGRADVAVRREKGVYRRLEVVTDDEIGHIFGQLECEAVAELGPSSQPFTASRYLDLRFVGLDEPATIEQPEDGDFQQAYESAFEKQCGYLPTKPSDRVVEVVAARVTVSVAAVSDLPKSERLPNARVPKASGGTHAYFGGKRTATGVMHRADLVPGDRVLGPVIITESVSTIAVDPGWSAEVMTGGELLLLRLGASDTSAKSSGLSSEPAGRDEKPDPVLLEVFNKRFAAIATQMGAILRRVSRSVNVKERLDYSCAIFTSSGDLVVNAPHVPVHLGAMGSTVQHVLRTMNLNKGDVVITNDPYHGGSHLPDVTVITPVHDASGELLFLTASRAHHAEIGGIVPGSMPAFSKSLAEEGVLIRAMKVVDGGQSKMDHVQFLLVKSPYPSRDPAVNIADIAAQIAANQKGVKSLQRFIEEYSWRTVSRYMDFIQAAAEQKTRLVLSRLPDRSKRFVDHLDDGSRIVVTLTIEGDSAILDFTGTDGVLDSNLNANRAIVTAATLYSLRLLIDEDIPLNQGVLAPIRVILPECLLNPSGSEIPALCPAIAGGNVETSQRVVDVVLGALGLAAASQGTMNNFLFGNDRFGYYETICGGAGATSHSVGADAVHSHMTNTRLTDPEVLETRFPVRLRRFGIRRQSGGSGSSKGGDGVIREVEFLDALQVSLLTQRRGEFAPYGMAGGQPGAVGVNTLIEADGRETKLGGIASLNVEPGQAIRIETPGGGGWGQPE